MISEPIRFSAILETFNSGSAVLVLLISVAFCRTRSIAGAQI
jgi:hypothetical protein